MWFQIEIILNRVNRCVVVSCRKVVLIDNNYWEKHKVHFAERTVTNYGRKSFQKNVCLMFYYCDDEIVNYEFYLRESSSKFCALSFE